MKSSLCLLITLFAIQNLSAHKEESDVKWTNDFIITNQYTDATLPVASAQFKFTFYESDTICTKKIRIGFNDSESAMAPDKNGLIKHRVLNGKYKLYFYIEGCNEIMTDSVEIDSKEIIEAEIRFRKTNEMIIVFKPVIYVYPTKETAVNIQLKVNGNLGFTYPAYNNGWNFTASPNGNIKMNNKEYNYLFWDSEMPKDALDKNIRTGFLVSSDTLLSFLENSLNMMGFTSKESADFITFWYPQMQKNATNYVHFLFNEKCDAYAELNITPKPDHIFRIGIIWSPANENSDFIPDPQKIPTLSRDGFTVIEWGGMVMESLFSLEN